MSTLYFVFGILQAINGWMYLKQKNEITQIEKVWKQKKH